VRGRATRLSDGWCSFDVTAVRPLELVALETLLGRPDASPEAAADRDCVEWNAFRCSELVPEVDEDLRCAAAARALMVWFAACL
jgi:hypothetical protein